MGSSPTGGANCENGVESATWAELGRSPRKVRILHSQPINISMQLTQIVEDYRTKDGQDIEMVRVDDAEGDNNRGWRVDEVHAKIDGKKVGYIKLSYIPHERFHRYYPTIFNFLDQIKGQNNLPYEKRAQHYKEFTDEERRKMLKSLLFSNRLVRWGQEDEAVKNLSDDEVLQQIRDIEEKFNNGHHGREFRKFKNFQKDKPLVDFIRVEDDWRRQRIGNALYREAATWMKEKGMEVYASGLQTDDAKASWKHMKDQTKKAKRGRRILRPDEAA